MAKLFRKVKSQSFATTIGLLIIAAVFGLAIGVALFVQNERHGRQQIWPLNYFGAMAGVLK